MSETTEKSFDKDTYTFIFNCCFKSKWSLIFVMQVFQGSLSFQIKISYFGENIFKHRTNSIISWHGKSSSWAYNAFLMYTYLPTSKLHIIIKDIFPNMNEKLCGNHFEYRNTLGLSSTTIWRSTHRMKSSTITSYFLQAKYCLWWADLLNKKRYLQSHLCRIALEYANQKYT